MLKVGITGGIGSGKSMVSECFKQLGIPVYNADDAAKRLMNSNADLRSLLIKNFTENIYNEDASLNSKWLAAQVFNDEIKLNKLNSLVHPAVAKDYIDWSNNHQFSPYTIREAAIMFESGTIKDLNFIILVDAPEELRVARVMSRDNRSADEIKSIMGRQWQSEKKRKLADAIIENDDQHLVLPQVIILHSKLLNYGS